MTPLDRLRQAAELLPAGASVTVSREALLEALSGAPAPTAHVCSPPGDLTVAELAARFQRSPSTVRGWLEADRFPGAYKLNRKDWRVPIAALAAFRDAQQQPARGTDLGAWRQRRRPA
jgi:hypothetical protein